MLGLSDQRGRLEAIRRQDEVRERATEGEPAYGHRSVRTLKRSESLCDGRVKAIHHRALLP